MTPSPASGRRRLLWPLLVLGLLPLMMGCGAYFNTYYNANKAYRKGEQTYALSGAKSARASYDDCLRISSKLLQFYPESRWVDDTILLIGQCYVRLDQHHRALRKFDELEAGFPDSPLLPRGRIWRARALLALEREDDCQLELARLDLATMDRADRVEALRVASALHRKRGSRQRLLESQEALLKTARRQADRAEINAEMAATYEEEGNWEAALGHYNAVRRHRPNFSLLFRSWLGNLDNNLRLGRLESVERRLRKLRKDERFYAERHALDLRQGWLAEQRGDPGRAKGEWAAILKDFPRTASSAGAAYSLGRIFLFADDQLDSARTYFKRASSEKAGSVWADSSTTALALLESLDKTHKEIKRLDDLIRVRLVKLDPDSARHEAARALLPRLRATRDSLRADSLRQLEVPPSDSLVVAGGEEERDPPALATEEREGLPVVAADTLDGTRGGRDARRGGRVRLFDFQRKEREAERADSLRAAQLADSLHLAEERARQRWDDSLLVTAVLDTLSRHPAIDSLRLVAEADSLAGLRFDQRFYLAEFQAKRLSRPQRADSLMRDLLADQAATREQQARLHYAYGCLRLDQFADTSGLAWLRGLVETWPQTPAANPARDRLGLPRAMTEADSATVLLESAEKLWLREGDLLGAMAAYQELADRHPTTAQAATALLAAGTIAWHELERPEWGEPTFRRVLRDFPDHPAAAQLRRRLGQEVAVAAPKAKAVAEERQVVQTEEAHLSESGGFIDPEPAKPLADRLQDFRRRFGELGRLRVDQILE
ncbi:MAG: tetratricopeptide repeat protein [bacterium]|jgi:TolA-binding protein|nr:tetratricopeptide repeat protein [bacterium]